MGICLPVAFPASILRPEFLQIFGSIGQRHHFFTLGHFPDFFHRVRISQGRNISGIQVVGDSGEESSAGSAMLLSLGYFSMSVGGACTRLPLIIAFNSSAFTPALLSK